jgi:hypothetical protein
MSMRATDPDVATLLMGVGAGRSLIDDGLLDLGEFGALCGNLRQVKSGSGVGIPPCVYTQRRLARTENKSQSHR